jgi:hypothetical protein
MYLFFTVCDRCDWDDVAGPKNKRLAGMEGAGDHKRLTCRELLLKGGLVSAADKEWGDYTRKEWKAIDRLFIRLANSGTATPEETCLLLKLTAINPVVPEDVRQNLLCILSTK